MTTSSIHQWFINRTKLTSICNIILAIATLITFLNLFTKIPVPAWASFIFCTSGAIYFLVRAAGYAQHILYVATGGGGTIKKFPTPADPTPPEEVRKEA